MTTITKERAELKAFIAGFLSDPAHDNQSSRSMTAEVFRIALASLDAKPIYQYQSGIYNDDNGETDWYWDDCDAGFYKQYAADRRRIVYTAAPAPVVPPAIEPDYEVIKSILPTANPDEYACCIAADMWNACRADMFQGSQPVSNRDELSSPVITDGYALVPVEPTPEMREAFHVANEEYESGSYDVWKPDHQWQAMLAAAPQLKIALASIERCQAGFDAKHALFEVAIARFSKMNEGFPIKRFKADWVISWMLENFPPVAQKQGDN